MEEINLLYYNNFFKMDLNKNKALNLDNNGVSHDLLKDKPDNLERSSFFRKDPWIIVGFDPGLTVGIAIIDLSGNLLFLSSFKEISKAEVINNIISFGRALIVATDVYPIPKSVKKLATALNSKIYAPSKIMSVESKKELVDSFIKTLSPGQVIENAHQRDALAAAIKTYKNYEKKLNQIEKKTSEMDLNPEEMDKIKSLFISGTPITKAINEVSGEKNSFNAMDKQRNEIKSPLSKKSQEDMLPPHTYPDQATSKTDENNISLPESSEFILKLKKRIKTQEKQIKKQEGIIKNLRDKTKISRNKIQRNKKEISQLKSRIDKVHQDYSKDILLNKELSSKVELIKKLINQYKEEKSHRKRLEENLKSIHKIRSMEISKNDVPVKIVKSFTKEGIKEAGEYWKIKKGDVILLKTSRGGGSNTASVLVDIGLKAIIITDQMSHTAREVFEKEDIPVINADKLQLRMVDEFAIIKAETLNNEIAKWNSKLKEQRKKEEEKKLLTVIDEYRAKRKRKPVD